MKENSLLNNPRMGYIFRGAYIYFKILIHVFIESQLKYPGSLSIRYTCRAYPRRDKHISRNARAVSSLPNSTKLDVRCEEHARLAVDTLGKCSGLKRNLDFLTDFQ